MSTHCIVLVGSLPPPFHGSNIYFESLLKSEVSNEFDVIHLDTADKRSLDNIAKFDLTNAYLAIKNIAELFFICLAKKPAMVYVPIAQGTLGYMRDGLFVFAAWAAGVRKIVVHLHGGYFKTFYETSGVLMEKFIRTSLSLVDTGIVLSNNLRFTLDGLVKRIVVVENGIPLTEYRPKRVSAQKGEKIKIGYLGNLIESKGVLDLLSAAVIVLDQRHDVEFVFAGSWRESEMRAKNRAGEMLKQEKLKESVRFTGVLLGEEKEEFLRTLNIFAFPTRYPFEGFPLVILEAMRAGKPIVSTKDVGHRSNRAWNHRFTCRKTETL